MEYSTSQAVEDMETGFEIEEEWEFAAPMYYDFLAPSPDDLSADVWFDYKLDDDISPEINEDEFEVQHDFGSVTPTPSSVRSTYSVASTPMTPGWRSRIEERSPQREDNVKGRHIVEVMRSTVISQPNSPMKIKADPAESSTSPSILEQPPIIEPEESRCTFTATSLTKLPTTAQAPVFKTKLFTMPVPPTTLGTIGQVQPPQTSSRIPTAPATGTNRIQSSASQQTVPKNALKVSLPINTTSVGLTSTTTLKPVTKVVVPKPAKEIPFKHQPFASQRNVVAPIRSNLGLLSHPKGGAKSNQPISSGGSSTEGPTAGAAPRFMAPTQSQLAKTKLAKPPTTTATTKSSSSYEIHAHNYQAKVMMNKKKHQQATIVSDKENLINQASSVPSKASSKSTLPSSRQRSPMSVAKKRGLGITKSTPNTLRMLREQQARPLTLAVTPELMKRRVARIRQDAPRLTTEELRAIEADRARREFLAEQHRKNANRGLAPRLVFDSMRQPTAKAVTVSHWR